MNMDTSDSMLQAAQIIGNVGSAVVASDINKKTMKYNKEMAEDQRNWSEKMYNNQNAWNYERWLEQNEYNSPVAQVQRLRDAGLNPLYYGLDGSSAGEVTAAQPLGYERAQIDNLQNPVSAGLSAAAQVAQISNLQAQTAKVGQETQSEVVRREQMQLEIENTKQEFNNMLAQEGLDKAKREEIERGLVWLDRLNESVLNMRESETKLNDSTRNRIDKLVDGEVLLQSKSLDDFEYKWRKIEVEIKKIAAETDLDVADLENYALNHASNGFMGTGLSAQNIARWIKQSGKNDSQAWTAPTNDTNQAMRDLINAGQ